MTSTDDLMLTGHHAPSISVGDVDLDGDGEIAVQGALIDHEGNVVWQIPGSFDHPDTGYGWFVWPGADMTLLPTSMRTRSWSSFIRTESGTTMARLWTNVLPEGSTAVNLIGRVVTDRPEYTGG